MNKNIKMYIAAGNSLGSLITYDFKNENPWTDVNNEADPLEKFRRYKAKKNRLLTATVPMGRVP